MTSAAVADFAEEFAGFSSALRVADLPARVIAATKANLIDILACAAAGWSAPGVASLVSLVEEWGGKPEASVWCSGLRVPAHHAALVNGTMAHARDYDDTHDGAVLHAGVSVVPAAMAAAELDPSATGADLVAGIAAGLELICRLGTATSIGIIESGFMYTSLFGHFAATAAAARVLRFDRDATVNALGIAYSQAAGTHQVTRDAALTKRVQPGFAAKSALVSVALARRGISGARSTFEGIDGLFRTYLRERYDPRRLRAGLGTHFEMLALSYKPYPCCRFNHAAIDAALAVRAQLGGNAADIESVSCGVNRQAHEAVCLPADIRCAPQTIVQAQFSLPYTVACALTNGRVGLQDFTGGSLRNADVLALAQKVHAYVDEGIEGKFSRGVTPALLVARTGRGEYTARVEVPRGHPDNPLGPGDLEAKLADCLAASGLGRPAEAVGRIRSLVEEVEVLPAPGIILQPLAG
jgi:2-methylcitrate dehydratase PrpD